MKKWNKENANQFPLRLRSTWLICVDIRPCFLSTSYLIVVISCSYQTKFVSCCSFYAAPATLFRNFYAIFCAIFLNFEFSANRRSCDKGECIHHRPDIKSQTSFFKREAIPLSYLHSLNKAYSFCIFTNVD
jgi:hypothetical protein